MSSEEAHPGARASRPHKSSRSFGYLLHRNQPAAAPCLCFGRAHAVPAGRAVGCNIAGKLSGNRRDSMRAGRPRSRGCRPDGEVGGIRRATSLKAGLSPLGNSRLPASRAPAPRDWADPSRRTINGTSMHRIDQDKQDEKLVHKKLIGSIFECAFVENLSVLRGSSRIPFESFPTPWNPFADSSFALLTDPLSPLVEIFSPFPTFGGSLLSSLHPLSGPS